MTLPSFIHLFAAACLFPFLDACVGAFSFIIREG
ncbi:hypothetical protein V6Z12_A03G135700 [Gossypium hirsutum]